MTTPNTQRVRVAFRRELPHLTLDVALDVPGRGVTALFGPSGAGKTTCLRVIAGLDRFRGAQVEVKGETWQDDSRALFVPVERRHVGFVFQDGCLFPHLTVRGNLDFGRNRRVGEPSAVRFEQAVELLGIAPLLERTPEKLSGGERQRVAIARALLAAPRLLLLDEPLASIDVNRKQEILPWIERLRDELSVPILYVSHSVEEVVRLADHVVRLEHGRIAASGPLRQLVHQLAGATPHEDLVGGVIETRVIDHDPAYGLLRVEFGAGRLVLAHGPLPAGHPLRIRILARDLSLATTEPERTSILNVLHGAVREVTDDRDGAHRLVTVMVGDIPLVARITRYSWDRLELGVGTEVWLQLKAAAVVA